MGPVPSFSRRDLGVGIAVLTAACASMGVGLMGFVDDGAPPRPVPVVVVTPLGG